MFSLSPSLGPEWHRYSHQHRPLPADSRGQRKWTHGDTRAGAKNYNQDQQRLLYFSNYEVHQHTFYDCYLPKSKLIIGVRCIDVQEQQSKQLIAILDWCILIIQ